MNKRPKQQAACHPERPHHAFGMCSSCYRVNWLARNPKEYEKNKDRAKQWARSHPERVQANRRKASYNLSPERHAEMLKQQRNQCAICQEHLLVPHVDHDHRCCASEKSCGKCVRGLLCDNCNRGLGSFHDSQGLMRHAIEYLRKYKGQA